jgi:hypothetical protein
MVPTNGANQSDASIPTSRGFRVEAEFPADLVPYRAAFTNKLREVNNGWFNQAFVFSKSRSKRHPNMKTTIMISRVAGMTRK